MYLWGLCWSGLPCRSSTYPWKDSSSIRSLSFSESAHNGPDLHRQHCTSTQTSPASLAGGTSTVGLGGASTLAASRGLPPSGPTLTRLRETPTNSALVSLARSANAPLSHDNILNIRSLTGKGHVIQDILTDRKFDFFCLNETWQVHEDFSQLNDSTPPGFVYSCKPMYRGGGLAILYREKWKVLPVSVPPLYSLECLACQISGPTPIIIATVYLPPKPQKDFLN